MSYDYCYSALSVFMSAYDNDYTVPSLHYKELTVCLQCVIMHYRHGLLGKCF